MLDPITVWMVQLDTGDRTDVEGTLHLTDDALVFGHAGKPAELRFPYATIGRVRRVLASPVLIVEWMERERPRRTAFYFRKPPPLEPPSADDLRRLGPLAQRRAMSRRRHERANLGYLATSGKRTKPLVRAWMVELRTRMRHAREPERPS